MTEDNECSLYPQLQLYQEVNSVYQTSFSFLCCFHMATILITGGTGLIGSALSKTLAAEGNKIIVLSRSGSEHKGEQNVRYAEWNIHEQKIDRTAIEQADYIIHLAGANVAEGRWTEKRKKELLDSRVKSGELLVKALGEIPNRVKAVISASGIGYYGEDPKVPNPKPFEEDAPAAQDFLGTVVTAWEGAVHPVTALGKRLVIFRTGLVFSKEGGAYPEFKKTLSFKLASVLGSGRQVISWIHIDDLVRLYIDAIEKESFSGIYNAVTPAPVTNKELITRIAAEKPGFHVTMHVPAFVLKTMLGEMSVEVLKSTTVSPRKLREQGFSFMYSTIDAAIRQLEA